jgi:hypothetical protein
MLAADFCRTDACGCPIQAQKFNNILAAGLLLVKFPGATVSCPYTLLQKTMLPIGNAALAIWLHLNSDILLTQTSTCM